ncbi:hypothetical protein LEP1GSC202_3020 [Leptospira yanagawae serovar Saopaulo str. Sao Paulo = ATCC 700523]|uniref:Uncharacterized protein n=1 Tax=Leptospira yanagawae serovar Saopaulo str. Sao Paulo = ATCC 700523 TaxID=1249483 RepID=A0A5E8HA62_9LEPT|nr:hypothetical protein LEP1GSC202_3020 [Leptospira yanagawae serovar Saopaulo str. Sao Paulo = ATCC 700523]
MGLNPFFQHPSLLSSIEKQTQNLILALPRFMNLRKVESV